MNSIIIFRRLANFHSDDWRVFVPMIGGFLFRCLAASVKMIGKRGVKMKENELAVGCAHLSAEIALLTAIANCTCYYATAVSDIISP
ncbi:hypothetical protein [Gardnerella swidsinskii]|uniref:hypothetical protein n=1 Tax=Gardnerella swidsinskii TaxID=2792979 RepID=UPI0013C37BB5|nr:hypothetical protein [Gardnerella swidsinskii]